MGLVLGDVESAKERRVEQGGGELADATAHVGAELAFVDHRGYDEALVRRVYRMLTRAEYKRRQAAPGVKITHLAFGRDYRYPITNGFDDKGRKP